MTINVVSEWRWAWQCDTLWQCNIRPPSVPTLAPLLSLSLWHCCQQGLGGLLSVQSGNPNSRIFYFLSHISELEPLLRLNWLITSRSQWFCCRSVIRGRCCVVQSWKQILGPRHQQYQECEHSPDISQAGSLALGLVPPWLLAQRIGLNSQRSKPKTRPIPYSQSVGIRIVKLSSLKYV